jgi:hypothetical protein
MKFPLLFTYKGTTIGNGYVAAVDMKGRAVVEIEQDGTWLYGVAPGAIAEGGKTLDDAHRHFRETLRLTLVDFITDAASFEDFQAEAERFFKDVNTSREDEWRAGVELVRQAHVTSLAFNGIPKWPAESETFIKVTRAELTPTLNNIESEAAVAAPAMPDADPAAA